jgi:hypothetical protein
MLEELLALPIEKKIGQLFFIGLPDTKLDAEIKELLREFRPAAFVCFPATFEDSSKPGNYSNRFVKICQSNRF